MHKQPSTKINKAQVKLKSIQSKIFMYFLKHTLKHKSIQKQEGKFHAMSILEKFILAASIAAARVAIPKIKHNLIKT